MSTRPWHAGEQAEITPVNEESPMRGEIVHCQKLDVAALDRMPRTSSRELPGFTVDVTLGEPRLAQQVCAEITSLFTNQNIRQRRQQAEDTTQLLAKQLEEAKTKLDEQEAKLAAFRSRYARALSEDEETNGTRLADMKSQLEALTQGLNQGRQERALDESHLNQQLAALKTAASRDNTQGSSNNLAIGRVGLPRSNGSTQTVIRTS